MDAVITAATYSLYGQLEAAFAFKPIDMDNSTVSLVSYTLVAYVRDMYKDRKAETDNIKSLFESGNEYSYSFEELKEKVLIKLFYLICI